MRLWLFSQYKICSPTKASIKTCHFSRWSSYNLTSVISQRHLPLKTNFSPLTTPPVGVTQFQVSAGASRVLLGSVRAAQGLNLVVEGFQSGVDLHIVLPKRAGSLISPHVPEGIRGLLSLTQTSKGRYVNSRAGRTRKAWRSRVTRRTLRKQVYKNLVIRHACACKAEMEKSVQGVLHTAGPDSPERPRGPGGPMGPGCPLDPSLPETPAGPGGPYKRIKSKTVVIMT